MHKHITALKEEYGPVYTIWLPEPIVYIQDFEHVRDALITHGALFQVTDSTHQATITWAATCTFPTRRFRRSKTAVSSSRRCALLKNRNEKKQGEEWKNDRRTSLQILRDFGMGKNIMEEQVTISVQECIRHIRSLPDKSRVDFRWPLQLLVGNVINRILFGFHYKYNDCERLKKYCDDLTYLIVWPRRNPLVFLAQRFPWIRQLPIIGYLAHGKYMKLHYKVGLLVHNKASAVRPRGHGHR